MTQSTDNKPNRRLSAKLAAGFVISAVLILGSFAPPANAAERGGDHRGNGRGYGGGYFSAPPVVYGSPYGTSYYGSPYYAPPVVYGPAVGISLPGINIGVR